MTGDSLLSHGVYEGILNLWSFYVLSLKVVFLKAKLSRDRYLQFPTDWCGTQHTALGCNGNEPHPLASLGLPPTMAASLKTVAKPAKSNPPCRSMGIWCYREVIHAHWTDFHNLQKLRIFWANVCPWLSFTAFTKGLIQHGGVHAAHVTLPFVFGSANDSFFQQCVMRGFFTAISLPTSCTAKSCFSPSVWLCNPWLVSNHPFSVVMNGLTSCFLVNSRKNVSELSNNNWN